MSNTSKQNLNSTNFTPHSLQEEVHLLERLYDTTYGTMESIEREMTN